MAKAPPSLRLSDKPFRERDLLITLENRTVRHEHSHRVQIPEGKQPEGTSYPPIGRRCGTWEKAPGRLQGQWQPYIPFDYAWQQGFMPAAPFSGQGISFRIGYE